MAVSCHYGPKTSSKMGVIPHCIRLCSTHSVGVTHTHRHIEGEAENVILQMYEHKNSPPFFLNQFFPTFPPTSTFISLSIHPFLHPSPSKASSQQSAIEFHYSLVMQHFKGGRAACVCNRGRVYTCNRVSVSVFFLQGISSSGTQQ